MELTYILFKIEELYFLIPLSAVMVVEAGGDRGKSGTVACDLGYLCEFRKQKKETEYILLLTTGTEEFRIFVDSVIGVRKIEDENMKELEAPLIWDKNKYLEKAAFVKDLAPPIAYILDVPELYEKILRQVEQKEHAAELGK